MSFRLNITKLREIAARMGDKTGGAISRRTGICESSVYRFLKGDAQPDLNSMMRVHEAYEVHVEELMERVEQPADQIETAA